MASNDAGGRLAELAEAVRESTLKRLRAVPEGLENWRPVPSAMSFADLAHHIAEADRWLFRKLEEPELPSMRGEAGAGTVADRAEFLALVEELVDLGRRRSALLRSMDTAALDRYLPDDRFGGEVSVWWIVVRGNLDHEAHHRGHLASYLRQVGEASGQRLTEAMNRVVEEVGSEMDDFSRRAARGVFERVEPYTHGPELHMRYKVALSKNEEGYSVSVPGLPGCWSQGATESEALENIEDAIREYLAVVAERLKDADVREVEVVV